MLIAIIVLVVWALINFWGFWEKDYYADSEMAWGSLCGAIMLYGVIGLILPRVMMMDSDKYTSYEYKDQPITSLINKSGTKINGAFFLGCGTVNGGSTDYYVAYAPMEKGDLRIKVDAYNTYVNESDSVDAVVKDYWIRKNWEGYNSLWVWNSKPKIREWQKNYGEKVVIVPTNTIYREFRIKD